MAIFDNKDNENASSEQSDQSKGARSFLEDSDKSPVADDSGDDDNELKNTKVYFKLDLRPKIVQIPDVDGYTKVNVKYDLMPPHCSCHIYWDHKSGELVYSVQEPELNDVEKEVLRLVTLGLEEMINISFINAAKNKMVVQYLEHNVQSILGELGAKVSMDTYQKIMYYIYRDFIGLNEIEPLLRDYYIEDIECNGSGTPVYIVHRKFRNIRTNIVFKEMPHLTVFVEKLSQKCGRYISYAKPILDGTLSDGSRVNATYSQDVTTRGPTFTIRKFTKDPWMPTNLINMNTASAETFAFFWLAVEYKLNIMTIGETGSGKTTLLNSIASFIPNETRICSIEDTRELNLAHENWLPSVTREGFGVTNVTGEKYGEIGLFDLLKESFRQNPDYVIVGEVRDKETYVLFQGMASGHSCLSTFHASSVNALVRRLETPPISLPGSLIESMNVVAHMSHVREHDKSYRRLLDINEIIAVKDNGNVDQNLAFEYEPSEDTTKERSRPHIFQIISKLTGLSEEEIYKEMGVRAQLLQKMADNNLTDYREFSHTITEYYSNPRMVLERYGIKAESTMSEAEDRKRTEVQERRLEQKKKERLTKSS